MKRKGRRAPLWALQSGLSPLLLPEEAPLHGGMVSYRRICDKVWRRRRHPYHHCHHRFSSCRRPAAFSWLWRRRLLLLLRPHRAFSSPLPPSRAQNALRVTGKLTEQPSLYTLLATQGRCTQVEPATAGIVRGGINNAVALLLTQCLHSQSCPPADSAP